MFFMTLGLRFFVVGLHYVWTKRYIYVSFLFVLVKYFCDINIYPIYFLDVVIFCDVRITLYFGTFELRMKVTLQFRFIFVRHCDVFFITSELRFSLFDVVTFFNDVRISFYFGTFELRKEITLQLRSVLVRHYDVFFITSQLRCLFVRCSYVFWLSLNYVIIRYVRITYGNYVIKW